MQKEKKQIKLYNKTKEIGKNKQNKIYIYIYNENKCTYLFRSLSTKQSCFSHLPGNGAKICLTPKRLENKVVVVK